MSDAKIGRTPANDASGPVDLAGSTHLEHLTPERKRFGFPQFPALFWVPGDPKGPQRVPPAASGLPLDIAG